MICEKIVSIAHSLKGLCAFFCGIMERAGGSLSSGLGSVGQNAATEPADESGTKAL